MTSTSLMCNCNSMVMFDCAKLVIILSLTVMGRAVCVFQYLLYKFRPSRVHYNSGLTFDARWTRTLEPVLKFANERVLQYYRIVTNTNITRFNEV